MLNLGVDAEKTKAKLPALGWGDDGWDEDDN